MKTQKINTVTGYDAMAEYCIVMSAWEVYAKPSDAAEWTTLSTNIGGPHLSDDAMAIIAEGYVLAAINNGLV